LHWLVASLWLFLACSSQRTARTDTQVTQNMQQLLLNLGRMMHIVYRQASHERLYHYCTKSQHRFLDAVYLVVDHLYLVEPERHHAATEQPLLGDLYQALIGHNVDAVMPADPVWQHDDEGQPESYAQGCVECVDRRQLVRIVRVDERQRQDIQHRQEQGDRSKDEALAHDDRVLPENHLHFFIFELLFEVTDRGIRIRSFFCHKSIVAEVPF